MDILIYSESIAKFLLLSHSNKFSLPGALCDSSSTTTQLLSSTHPVSTLTASANTQDLPVSPGIILV